MKLVMNTVKTTNRDTQNRTETQTRIVDAAIRCVQRWGIAKVSLNDVAKEAGVSRPTVYSYFNSRDEVVRFALLQSAYAFGEKLLKHINKFDSPTERTLEAMMYALKRIPKEPHLNLVTDTGLAQIMSEYGLSTPEGREISRSLFKIILKDSVFDDDELDELGEVAARFLLSLLSLKGHKKRNDKELKLFLTRRLLPALGIQ